MLRRRFGSEGLDLRLSEGKFNPLLRRYVV